jgi:hypothetical protein
MGSSLVTNSFRVPLLKDLTVPYRLVRFEGLLVEDEDYDKNVQLLATTLGKQLKAPVALIWQQDEPMLAVTMTGKDLPDRANLCGAVARLHAESKALTLRFCGGDEKEREIAKKFLRWELRRSFYQDRRFWEHYGKQTERVPLVLDGYTGPIDVCRSYGYGLVPSPTGEFELSVDVSFCYVGQHSLRDVYHPAELQDLRFERCLHKYALDWYLVEVSGPARRLSAIDIPDPDDGKLVGFLSLVKKRWSKEGITEIDQLRENDFALYYKNSDNKTRWAATPLLYRIYSPEDMEGAEIHGRSILAPHIRQHAIEDVIRTVFSGREIFGQPLMIESIMRRLPNCKAPLPRLVFGNDSELSLNTSTLRTDKWEALRAPGVGPYTRTVFDAQYVVLPASIHRSVAADFMTKVKQEIADLYPEPYEPELLVYDDSPRILAGQLCAMTEAIGNRRGYLLQVLPRYPHPKLYTFLKRKQADLNIASQCARSENIVSFYRETSPGKWEIKPSQRSAYRSYIRYLSLGVLAVNRKWLWRLTDGTLHCPGYIGIDVYKGTAVFTFVYLDGRDIYFQPARSNREERLSREMVCELLLRRLPKDFQRLGLCPRFLVIHRDGRLCTSERRALKEVAAKLRAAGIVAADFEFIVVEVHKSSAYHSRFFWEQNERTFNPRMGAYRIIDGREGLVCTTGDPLLAQGTADPVHLVRVMGSATTQEIIEDFYALSHLGFTAPGACHRLAFTLALADHVLRERRPERADEQPWDEEESMGTHDVLYDHP